MKKTLLGLLGVILVVSLVYYARPHEPAGVVRGDLVEVKYTITLDNGTVYGTTNTELARTSNVSIFHHDSYQYLVGESEIYPLDEVVLGMRSGESKQKRFVPAVLGGTKSIPRYKVTKRLLSFPMRPKFSQKQFSQYFGDVAVNDTVRNELYFPWSFRIVNMSENDSVRLEAIVKDGESYVVPGTYWNSTITDSWTGTIFLEQEPGLGQVIEASWGSVVVTNFTADDITVRRDSSPGALMVLPAGMHVVTNMTETDIFVRKSRGLLQETPFVINLELLSVRPGVRPQKDKRESVVVDTTAPEASSLGVTDLVESS